MQPIGWYINRLRAMSPGEIATRLRRQGRFALERRGFGLAKPADPVAASLSFRWPVPADADVSAYRRVADRVVAGQFEFFDERFDLADGLDWNRDPKSGTVAPLSFGKTLNYRDNALVGDIKYIWELSRHLDLVPLAQAYALTGDAAYLSALRRLIGGWIEQCPYPLGPNWCSSLELGIRLINWHFIYVLCGGPDSPLFDGEEGRRFRDQWSRSVYQHVHFIMGHLSSHSSANNHLIGELAGVFVAASVWPLWPEMSEWRSRAQALLIEQAAEQTYPDGVNKEQAVSYQQFVMYFLVLSGIVGERCAMPFGNEFWQRLYRMTAYVDALLDSSGGMPMIGDADEGLVFQLARPDFEPFRSLLAIGGRLFDVPAWRDRFPSDQETARWLCEDLEPVLQQEASDRQRAFPDGGYFLLGTRLGEPDEVRIVVDAGPLGFLSIAAHGHADCLSLTLTVAGRELLIDPGTYCYHSERDWRDYFRGTSAHNTVRVDGEDQSTISGPFMWDRKAEAAVDEFASTQTEDRLRARHFGYRRFADPVVHMRDIRFDKHTLTLDVIDEIDCRGSHRVERFWHFAEHCEVSVSGRTVTAGSGPVSMTLSTDDSGAPAEHHRGSLTPKGGWISRRFGTKEPTSTVVFTDQIEGRRQLRTRISLKQV